MTNRDFLPLAVLASCSGGHCPTIFSTGRGTVIVQGNIVNPQAAGVEVPDGEQLVEVPHDLLVRAMRAAEDA
jgi:hypothetical protein